MPLIQLEKVGFSCGSSAHSTDINTESVCCKIYHYTVVSECMVQGSALYSDGIDGRPDHIRGPQRAMEGARRTSGLVALATLGLNARG